MSEVASTPARVEPPELAQLAREHEGALRSVALRLCAGNQAEAADLVQDTFERAMRQLHRFEPGSNARAWLCTILRHLFIDRCRAPAARTLPVDNLELAAPVPEREREPVWAQITREQLGAAVERLEPEFRVVYDLATVENLSYPEIGTRLGLPKNTVGTRLMRARQKLRAMLMPHIRRAPSEEGTP
jgi:RNA polymerase sigma-70 factor (ECF subfamily)